MKRLIRYTSEWSILVLSALIFKITGRTPVRGFFSLLHLHASSNGRITERLAHFVRSISAQNVPIDSDSNGSVIPPLTSEEMEGLLHTLDEDGYAVYPYQLSPETCERLRVLCRGIEGTEWYQEGVTQNLKTYEQRSNKTGKIQFDAKELTKSADVQALMADTSLLQLAQKNLGAFPILDSVTAWWSFATTGKPSSEIAQMYHYDMERIQWLKVFFYLTDVAPTNGPHVYVKGSHKSEPCRARMLGRGYVRIPDEDIEAAYGKDRIVEVCAPAGTILMGNTMAQHKGKAPEEGERLIFELQFTNSLFGANLERISVKGGIKEKLMRMREKYPYVFQQVSIDG